MKDKKARRDIRLTELDIEVLKRGRDKDKGDVLYARWCPKCEHKTPQTGRTHSVYIALGEKVYDYECLVCGSKLKCDMECKVVEDKQGTNKEVK